MHSVLFTLGPITVHSYGAMAALGLLAAAWLLNLNRKYANLTSDQASTILFIGLIFGLLGARLFYVVQFFDEFRGQLGRVIRIDQGGLVFYGGFLCAIAAIYIYCRKRKLDIIRVFDIVTPAMAVAHGLGRIGCFLHGCCFGKPTTLPWGVHFPEGTLPAQRYPGQALHPVQLYEAGEQFLLFGLYFYLVRRAPRGVAMSVYFILYGILRFLNELLRGDHSRTTIFTSAQFIGLGITPVGILLLIYFIRHDRRKNAAL